MSKWLVATLGLGAAVSSPIPAVSVAFGLGSVAVGAWDGTVPGSIVNRVRALRGWLSWPGVVD